MGALECLEMVVAADEPVGGRELARLLEMDRVRVNRLLMTLAHCGVLERTENGRYRPGPGIHVLAALAAEGSSLQRLALRHIRPWLNDQFAVTLGVLWRGYICYVIRARPGMALEESLGGRRAPALDSSAGLMLLASISDAQRASIRMEEPVMSLSEGLSVQQLINRTRKDGYAHLRFKGNVLSVACPVGDPPVAALAVSARGLQQNDAPDVAARLKITADAIAAELTAR